MDDDVYGIPAKRAIEAYAKEKTPSLTDQLLYAILAQLDKANDQLTKLANEEE